ncbi:MAG: outer-membrane lipoprotein carrier protein LolA [Pyrinomonadaceae bacterium]
MMRFIKFSLIAAVAVMFFSALAVTETKAQASVKNEILKRMEDNRNSLDTLKTSVEMVKLNAQLGEREIYQGSAVYVPAKGRDVLVRIDWAKPVQETLTVANKKYTIYQPRLKQAMEGSASDAKGGSGKASSLFAFIDMSKAELKANYEIEYLGPENVKGGTPTWHLEMTPKGQASFKVAEMWVDANGMPLQIKITEKNKDTTEIFLSGIRKNESVKASIFQQKLPPGTKIIK